MRKRNCRVKALKPNPNGAQKINILFEDLVVKTVDDYVHLESCVPFTKIRSLTSSGVRRLIASFLGTTATNVQENEAVESYQSTGLAYGSDLPMVVLLTGPMLYVVADHFKEQGLSEKEVEGRLKSRPEWYGIVDGLHSHAALSFIKANYLQWNSFKWYVKKLHTGFPVEKYRQLARVQNSRHSPSFYVELTLFDVLFNLRLEHETLKREKKKCGGSETAHAYDGALHARNSTLQQKANVSIRLPMSVLKEIGKIMNADHPEIILASKNFAKFGAKTEDELMERVDCRRFRSFINIATLKGSPMFMNASGENSEKVQISTLHRIKDLYLVSNFKTIQPEDLTKQFKYAQLAHREHEKFLRFIEATEWPKEMESIERNMLGSVMLDKELEENSGNEFVVLPKILQSFKRHFPDMAVLKEAKWKASSEEVTTPLNSVVPDSVDPPTPANEANPQIPREHTDSEAKSAEIGEPEPVVDNQLQAPQDNDQEARRNDVLNEKKINALNLDWQQYMTDERTERSPKFDLLLTSPPSAPSRSYIRCMKPSYCIEEIEKSEMQEFCTFIKRVLKTGSYIILLIHFTMFKEWYEVFDSNGLMVMPNEFIITYDQKTVKRRKVSHFNQAGHDIALIAKLQGAHPSGFMPAFDDDSDEGNDSMTSKRLALLRNAPATRSFLCKNGTKVPFDTKEFHPAIFKSFIELYCPDGVLVLDPFARTMTSGLAALRTRRPCILLEKSKDCYEAALERLRDAASPLPCTISLMDDSYIPPSSEQCVSEETSNEKLENTFDNHSEQEIEPLVSSTGNSVGEICSVTKKRMDSKSIRNRIEESKTSANDSKDVNQSSKLGTHTKQSADDSTNIISNQESVDDEVLDKLAMQ